MPLGSGLTRYLSDEILAQLRNHVNKFFRQIFFQRDARRFLDEKTRFSKKFGGENIRRRRGAAREKKFNFRARAVFRAIAAREIVRKIRVGEERRKNQPILAYTTLNDNRWN